MPTAATTRDALSARRFRRPRRDRRDSERGPDKCDRETYDANVRVAEPVGQLHVGKRRGRRGGCDCEGNQPPLSLGRDDRHPYEACEKRYDNYYGNDDVRIRKEIVEADCHVLLEQHSDPEDGEREEQERQERHSVVVSAVLTKRRGDSDN
jgi:hypothetical protein